MTRPIITAQGLSKTYGGHVLFDDATFEIARGEHIAIVGPNGTGKSTLLRILAGRERPDHGSVNLEPFTSHWFDQHPTIAPGATVTDILASEPFVPAVLAREKVDLEARIADPALYEQPGFETVLERYAELEREIGTASEAPAIDEALLGALGFTEEDADRSVQELSGGQKTRLRLARTLTDAKPDDLVVLDEPTNHLDIASIEWLEDWANAYRGTLLVVAHDRAFLDNVARRIFEVRQGRLTTYHGNFEDYVQARDENLARIRRDREKAQKRLSDEEAVLAQFRKQKRFDGQYGSRKKRMQKYAAALDETPDPVLEKLGFGLHFQAAHKSSEEVVRLTGITKRFDGDVVLDGLDFELTKGERVGLIGPNGSGKTTLLNLIAGRLRPDAGTVRTPPGVESKFLRQEHEGLDPERTLADQIHASRPGLEDRDVMALLGRFRFNPDVDMTRRVRTLSGGERQRMMLLKAILEPVNLLIMDEPTNHLDLWARDVVVQSLQRYNGSLLVVSHDRFLLDSVTEETAVLRDGRVQVHQGSYSEVRERLDTEPSGAKRSRAYEVRKRFTDWTTDTRYVAGQKVELDDADIEASASLRNALRQGWLAPAGE